jgi:hypothetical protein
MMRVVWAGQAMRLGKTKDAYKIVVLRPTGPGPLGKLRCTLEVRVTKLILKKTGNQYTCNVRGIRATVVVVEKQYGLHIPSVCL